MSTSVPMVQATAEHVSALLAGLLPVAPTSLLLLGKQSGTYATGLEAMGYQVSTYPLCNSDVFPLLPSGSRPGTCQVNLTLPDAATETFGAALVLDFSPEVHPLALFDQLAHWLAKDAVVVLVGPKSGALAPRVRQWLDFVVAIAARCGFSAQEVATDGAGDSEDFVIRMFRKVALPRWQLRHVRPADYAEIATLFQEVFGHPLSREMWEWKYANGHGNAVSARHDGVLIAHYGGMYRNILLCGVPDWAYGGCDVMVHPKERGVMTRQGPFLLTAATTAEIYGPVAYGFPTERAMQVAEKMGLYSRAGQMAEVRWAPAAPGFRLSTRVRALTRENAKDRLLVDSLWTAMANDLRHAVVGVRDWEYLEHRYFAHPHNHYEVLALTSRITGRPLGVMVLRRLESSCELLDVIAPLANLDVVIDQARRMTARWGLAHLYCWITTNYASLFTAHAGKEEALNVLIPTSCWTDDPRVDMLKDKWWLMSGDTDFR